MGRPFALDFGTLMTMGRHLRADLELLASVLPRVEDVIIANINGDDTEPAEGE